MALLLAFVTIHAQPAELTAMLRDHTKMKLIKDDPLQNAIYKSAENPYANAPTGNDLFKEFNALAVLLAGIEILGKANGQSQ